MEDRRRSLRASTIAGAGLVLAACQKNSDQKQAAEKEQAKDHEKGGEVTATEDLMREHGVLRRALLVYSAGSVKLRTNASSIPPDALQKAARLFRAFGEEYHENKLEEVYIFPAVKKVAVEAATYPDILKVMSEDPDGNPIELFEPGSQTNA